MEAAECLRKRAAELDEAIEDASKAIRFHIDSIAAERDNLARLKEDKARLLEGAARLEAFIEQEKRSA